MTDRSNRIHSQADSRRVTEQAASWYLDQREGLSAADQQAFLRWLKQSPMHVGEYLAIAHMHGDLHAAAAMETMDTAQLRALAASEPAVVMLRGQRDEPFLLAARKTHSKTPRYSRSRRWLAAAGIAALVLFAGGAMLVAQGQQGDIYSSTADAGRSLSLPDGSLIELDRDSTIVVNFDARQRRIELLHGGALFDVGKDPSRPLQVQMGASMLRDIGTVFAVRRDDTGGEVTVVSGRVNVTSPNHSWLDALSRRFGRPSTPDNVVADLGAGEQAELGASGSLTTSNKHADIAQATAWLPLEIQFHNSTVSEVARRFNAYTTAPLQIDDPQMAGMRISGRFRARDVDAFVAYLASLPGVQVKRDDAHVQVIAAAALKRTHHRL